jgi:kinesin family protein 6/9
MTALPIRIYIRTRPTTVFAVENIKFLDDRQTINVHIEKGGALNFLNRTKSDYSFKFHSILHNVSQEIVFEEAAREIVDSFIQGYNGCIFSFGQRGAGKTFTMYGGIRHSKYRGVIPRSLAYTYQELEKFKTIQFKLSIQFFQVHNDVIYDLLSDEECDLQLGQDEEGNPIVQNLSIHAAPDILGAIQLLANGQAKLNSMEKKCDRKVHRSHTVFILDLVGRKGGRMTHSRLLMLDLAAHDEAPDASYVNQSIAYLEQIVISVANKTSGHIPFRRSKMTYLLRDALGGNCRTACIAAIWPEAQNNSASISTFQFAQDLYNLQNDAKVNIMEPDELRIERLEMEIATLRGEAELQHELNGNIKIDGLKRDEEAEMTNWFLELSLFSPVRINCNDVSRIK